MVAEFVKATRTKEKRIKFQTDSKITKLCFQKKRLLKFNIADYNSKMLKNKSNVLKRGSFR